MRGRDGGQSSVELVLVLPLVVLLLMALLQAGVLLRDQLLVVQAAREGARDTSSDRALGAVVPQSFAAVVGEDDIGVLPAERALVVDRERRAAPLVRADPSRFERPGGGRQVAGSRSLGHVPDSTPA